MNTDMIPEGIDPEIDVRLTAMVLGEASDFEAAQLHELMSQRPELAAWYQQLQRLHGELNQWAMLEQHLQGATTEEALDESGPWTLSPEKRASVLAVLGHGKVETPAKVLPLTMWQKISQYGPKRRGLWIAAGVAASLLVVCSTLMMSSRATYHNWRNAVVMRYDSAETTSVAPTPSSELSSPYFSQDDVEFSPQSPQSNTSGGFARRGMAGPSNAAPGYAAPSNTAGLPSSREWKGEVADSESGSGGTTRLFASPNTSNSSMQTVTPKVIVEEDTEQPQFTVPGGGAMMLGGVVRPTSPAEPDVSAPQSAPNELAPNELAQNQSAPNPSAQNGRAETDALFGLYATPADDAKTDYYVEPSKRSSETTELFKEEVARSDNQLTDASTYRSLSEKAPANSSDGRKSQLEELQSGLTSGIVDETRGYLRREAASNAPTAPAAPAGPGNIDRLETLAEQKPRADVEIDPFGDSIPAKKPSSGAGAKAGEKATPEDSLRVDDFGAITGGDSAGRMSGAGSGMGGGRGGLADKSKQEAEQILSDPEVQLGRDKASKKDSESLWDVEKAKEQSEWSKGRYGAVDQKEQNRENAALGDLANQEEFVTDFDAGPQSEIKGGKDATVENKTLMVQGTTLPELRMKSNKNEEETVVATDGADRWSRDVGREQELRERLFFDNGAVASTGRQLRQQLPEKARPTPGLNETLTEKERFSTFSLHVSDVSFKLALDSLAKGQWPEAAKIRLEEFLNAFDYQDPLPSEEEKVACQIEQVVHPFLMQRNVLRVAMRTSATGRNSATPLRLTLLLDNSGSMQRADRAQTVRRAFETLAKQLTPADQVTLISFANEPKLRADRVNGNEILNFVNILENSPVEGGTNIEAALRLALEKAQEAKTEGAQSRVILMTDGAVNLGDADPSSLSQLVLKMRDSGIAFDAAGISAQDLNDEVLEALTRQGDGRYYLLDNAEQVDGGFAQQIAGALRPSAKNVKVQVEFNPQRVRSYKLLGFEKHVLNKEDFRNDKVDAAELAAAEAGVALYHYEVLPDGVGDVGSVSVRFQDMATGLMVEKRWPIAYEPSTSRLDQANSSMKLATSAVLFAAHLKGEPLGENVDLQSIAETLGSLDSSYSNLDRVQQLRQMVESARQIAGASSGQR